MFAISKCHRGVQQTSVPQLPITTLPGLATAKQKLISFGIQYTCISCFFLYQINTMQFPYDFMVYILKIRENDVCQLCYSIFLAKRRTILCYGLELTYKYAEKYSLYTYVLTFNYLSNGPFFFTFHILVATKHVHVYVICIVGWLISHNTEAAFDKGLQEGNTDSQCSRV